MSAPVIPVYVPRMYGADLPRPTTQDEQAWAHLHVAMFLDGIAPETPENNVARAARYRAFAADYPALASLAMQHADRCDDSDVPF